MDSQFFEKSRLHSLHYFSEKYKSHDYYNKKQYRQRHKIENMFSRLKDWRRIATRYDCCAHTFLSAIHLAAIVIFYL